VLEDGLAIIDIYKRVAGSRICLPDKLTLPSTRNARISFRRTIPPPRRIESLRINDDLFLEVLKDGFPLPDIYERVTGSRFCLTEKSQCPRRDHQLA
jgi:hypothetical protein